MSKKEASIAILAIILIAMVLLSPVACTMNRHRVIAQAIKDGADPIAAKCAIEGDGDQPSSMCVLAATKAK